MAETVDRTVRQPIVDTLELNYMPYAMSVIVSRAIPEIDGFKPSHRKLLYTMYLMKLLGGNRSKSANIVGQTMKLNPHGDQAIYETMVRLTRGNEALLHPYIDSKGNFGKTYSRDMAFAAARYTEARLDPICNEIFGGLDRDAVDFINNYDGTMQEPLLLPAAFPSILVNSNQGIAVGMASNICSFNLREVCAATIAYLRDPAADLQAIMPAPDFSTGGYLISDAKSMAAIYQTGRGGFRLRSRYTYDKKNNLIEINEIPYSTTVEAIIDDLSNLVRTGKVKEINDVRDETDLGGLKITIDLKRSTDPEALMTKLFKLTSLESTFSCNFNLLINGTPRTLGIRGIIAEWISFRRVCVKRENTYELQRKQERLHLLQGLEIILLDIDKAIRIVRETEKESEVVPNLMAGFGIDEVQAEYVAEIRLRQLNRQYILQRTKDISALKAEIKRLQKLIGDTALLDEVIISDLERIAKDYGQDRRTELLNVKHVPVLEETDLIEDYNLRLFLTEHGYVKKIPLTSLRSAGDLKTKAEDQIILSQEGHNKAEIIFISDQASVYKLRAYDMKDHKPSDLGEYTPNLLELAEGEHIVYARMTDDYAGDLLFAFANGKIARIPLAAYETKTNRKKLINAYSATSPLVAVRYLPPETEEELVAISDIRKAIVFNTDMIPLKATRTSQGVQVLKSKKGSVLTMLVTLAESGIAEPRYYRNKNLPAVGTFLKDDTLVDRQVDLDSLLE
jgi:DNA gyrase subunit A